MEAAFAVARAPFAARSAPLRLAEGRIPLTDVQIEVLAAVATGATSAQIAKERGVTPGAIEQTLARICERLNIPRDEGTNQRILLVREYHRLCGNT
jgi:DNA-binding CsgD family transcriptional regulator